MSNVVVTTFYSTQYAKEKCFEKIIELISEIKEKFQITDENNNTICYQKCEPLYTYLNKVKSELENCEKNILTAVNYSEIHNLLNICSRFKCSSNILPDVAQFFKYVSQEQQVNERSQSELSEQGQNEQKDHPQHDVQLPASSSPTEHVAPRSVSIHQFSTPVSEILASKVSSPTALPKNAEVDINGTLPSSQLKPTQELVPTDKLEESVPGTTLLPTNSSDSHVVNLENDGILGVFGHSKYEQNKKCDTDTDQIESARSVTTNTCSTHVRNEDARDSDTPSFDGKHCDVHNGNSSSCNLDNSRTYTNVTEDGVKCFSDQGNGEENINAQVDQDNSSGNAVSTGKNDNKTTFQSQSSRSSTREELTDEQVTSISSHEASNIANVLPRGTANIPFIDNSLLENAEESKDELPVNIVIEGIGSIGNGIFLDGSDGNAQTIPYILYIVIIVVSITIVILLILLIKYTYLSRLFSNKKRRKRKAIEDKLQRILIEPSASKEKRIQLAYSSFEN